MTTDAIERLAYSPSEAAACIGVSVGTIRNLIKTGKLEHTRCDRRILIARGDLLRFLGQETERRKSFLERIKGV